MCPAVVKFKVFAVQANTAAKKIAYVDTTNREVAWVEAQRAAGRFDNALHVSAYVVDPTIAIFKTNYPDNVVYFDARLGQPKVQAGVFIVRFPAFKEPCRNDYLPVALRINVGPFPRRHILQLYRVRRPFYHVCVGDANYVAGMHYLGVVPIAADSPKAEIVYRNTAFLVSRQVEHELSVVITCVAELGIVPHGLTDAVFHIHIQSKPELDEARA